MALMPITILILGHYFLEHERLTALRVIGVLLGFAGVALLVGEDMFFSDGGARLTGQVAAVIATFCYAINGIYTKRLPAFDTVAVSAASLLTGSVLLALPMWNLQPWARRRAIGSAMGCAFGPWDIFDRCGDLGLLHDCQ